MKQRLCALVLFALAACGPSSNDASLPSSSAALRERTPDTQAPSIGVSGGVLVATTSGLLGRLHVVAGDPIVLRGVNLSGAEYACLQEGRFWDDPPGNRATIDAMRRWHVNVVRVPVNEECWLGINGAPRRYSGAPYQRAIAKFAELANGSGLIVEIDLHFGAGGKGLPHNDQYPGLDADHATDFWRSVAATFMANRSVIFNLINEPSITSWKCYLNGGCETPPVGSLGSWRVVGTQTVVSAIRKLGATNPIIIAGLRYSNDLSQWLKYAPTDPYGELVAGAHVYFDGLGCEDPACWTRQYAAIQEAGYPVLVDEFGELDCAHAKIDRLMAWADEQTPEIGYWAWSWNPFSCSSGPSLITNDLGAPTQTYGSGFRTHLRSVQ